LVFSGLFTLLLNVARPVAAARLVVPHELEVAARFECVASARPGDVVADAGQPVVRGRADAGVVGEVRRVDAARVQAEADEGQESLRVEFRMELRRREADRGPLELRVVAVVLDAKPFGRAADAGAEFVHRLRLEHVIPTAIDAAVT
jgi:hypothetical protein